MSEFGLEIELGERRDRPKKQRVDTRRSPYSNLCFVTQENGSATGLASVRTAKYVIVRTGKASGTQSLFIYVTKY